MDGRAEGGATVTELSARLAAHGPRRLLGRALGRAVRPALVPLAMRRLRGLPAAAPAEAVDSVFGFDVAGISIAPMQAVPEIRGLLELLAAEQPRVVLEVGTARGGTLWLFSRVAAEDALLVSVDLPHGRFGGGYPAWRIPLYRSFARAAQRVELLRGDSHADATLERVQQILGGRPVDFLFIDGDHTYDGVKRDFELYSPLVRAGGTVAFHDIVPQGAREDVWQVGEVPQFWAELREGHRVTELVEDWEQGRFGIGVVHL
jgi:cephalosporin hydroxylase